MPASDYDFLSSVHEDRIQRLEDRSTEILAKVSIQSSQFDHVNCQIKFLSDDIKEAFENVNKRLDKNAEIFEVQRNRMDKTDAGLLKVTDNEKVKAERWSTLRKTALPIILASVAVIANNFGQVAWNWLVRLWN